MTSFFPHVRCSFNKPTSKASRIRPNLSENILQKNRRSFQQETQIEVLFCQGWSQKKTLSLSKARSLCSFQSPTSFKSDTATTVHITDRCLNRWRVLGFDKCTSPKKLDRLPIANQDRPLWRRATPKAHPHSHLEDLWMGGKCGGRGIS